MSAKKERSNVIAQETVKKIENCTEVLQVRTPRVSVIEKVISLL